MLRFHLESPEYKMTLPVEPRFTAPMSQTVSVSVLVVRKDSNKVACIINKSMFDYIDRTAYRALAFDYLQREGSIYKTYLLFRHVSETPTRRRRVKYPPT